MWNLFDIQKMIGDAYRGLLSSVATDLVNSGMQYVSEYIANPIQLSDIPLFDQFMTASQYLALSLVIVFLYLRILQALRDIATGEDSPNFAEIIGSSAISIGFVFSFPYFMNHYMIPIVNQVVVWLGGDGASIKVNLAGEAINQVLPGNGAETANFHFLLIGLVFGIGAFALVISSYVVMAHLYVGMIMGPIFMSSYTNRGTVFRTFLTNFGAILFTKIIHVLLFKVIIATLAMNSFPMLLLSVVFIFVAAMGPHVLRIYMINTGIAQGAQAVGRFAMYKVMFSGFQRGN